MTALLKQKWAVITSDVSRVVIATGSLDVLVPYRRMGARRGAGTIYYDKERALALAQRIVAAIEAGEMLSVGTVDPPNLSVTWNAGAIDNLMDLRDSLNKGVAPADKGWRVELFAQVRK